MKLPNATKLLRDIVTGIDGTTFDPARVFCIIGVVAFLGFTGYDVFQNNHFDMINYGTAYALLLASGAAGVKIKESTEPKGSAPQSSTLL